MQDSLCIELEQTSYALQVLEGMATVIEDFPDRSALLFGRAAHIRQLLDRVSVPGLTAVVARPLMGKTWMLTEVARQWHEQGDLIGYHESKGAESSHLLYAVSNLYARWLSDSTMREQALSLWARHKEALVPRVGQMVGALFEKIASSAMPDKVAGLVRQAFDGLAEAQKDLFSGGLQIAPLPYDQALSLTKLVADVSGRRIVLMLDAWEKSAAARSEHATLEAFLKHIDDWPNAHVVLAVRHPELAAAKDNEAYERAKDFCVISAAAQLYDLREMNLADVAERGRLVSSIRQVVPAAQRVPEDQLLAMIDAYPGVVSFWTDKANRSAMALAEDLRKVAENAQRGRYAELDRLLKSVPEARCAVAARLAFLPRLDEVRWEVLRDLVLCGDRMVDVESLIDTAVLSEERVPTFGHDTRQAAARKWFVENRAQMIRRQGVHLVETLAARITGVNNASRIFFEELVGCATPASDVEVNSDVGFLIDAARCAFGDVSAALRPEFDARYPSRVQRDLALAPLIAQALYNRGVAKGQDGDSEGAIADYTAAIDLPGAPAEQVARALYSRGAGKGQRGDSEGAIADYTAAIALPRVPAEQIAKALTNRGVLKGQGGDSEGAIADYTEAIELPGATAEQIANALTNRGVAKGQSGDSEGAVADYTAAIALSGAPAEQVANALYYRGVTKGEKGDSEGAIADYTAAIALPGAAIALSGAPAEHIAQALFNSGVAKDQGGDSEGAISDYTSAIALSGAPAKQIANPLINRGVAKGQSGDIEGAVADFTAAIELPGASAEQIAMALTNRGVAKGQGGDIEGAVADYTAAIQFPGASHQIVDIACRRLDGLRG